MNKQLATLYKNMEAQGWTITQHKNGAVKAHKGDAVITLPSNIREHRAFKNLVSQLRVRHNVNISL